MIIKKGTFLIILFFSVLFLSNLGFTDERSCEESSIKINRDEKGIWFIKGSKHASLYKIYERMGYAVAQDRLWQAELFRRSARGRLAEIFGNDLLETDILMRTMGYSDNELTAKFEGMDRKSRRIISGYVDGFNNRIAEVLADPGQLPFEFAALGLVPEDWTAVDVMAWSVALQRNFDSQAPVQGQIENMYLFQNLQERNDFDVAWDMFNDLRWINDPDALTMIPPESTSVVSSNLGIKSVEGNAVGSAADTPDFRKAAGNILNRFKNAKEKLKKIKAYVKMGSQAWVVSGDKTQSGNPILYSGPQMGFSAPSVMLEGSIQAGKLNVSGMTVAGIPAILVGRTPYHAWSQQVGHGHTVDYYLEDPSQIYLHREETIKIAGNPDYQLKVYRTQQHGPLINPIPYDPMNIDPNNPPIAWKYAHWNYELNLSKAYLNIALADDINDFSRAIEDVALSNNFCYADKKGKIAYWMSGRDPARPAGEYRFPQGFFGIPLEWDATILKDRATDRNSSQGFYSGWNNKSKVDYDNSFNEILDYFGPFHHAQVIHDYLSTHDNLTFEELRDLALDVSTTDWGTRPNGGGNPWLFVDDYFITAVTGNPTSERMDALLIMEEWDGHMVEGVPAEWPNNPDLADGAVLLNAWIKEVLRLTFEDELDFSSMPFEEQNINILLNVFLRDFSGKNLYPSWFNNNLDPSAPQTSESIIVQALDNVLSVLGDRPWGVNARGHITFAHDLLGVLWSVPYSSRATYQQHVEMGKKGPIRIESMFPLGQSGNILMATDLSPIFDDNFYSMTPEFDAFKPRAFPLFRKH